MGKRHAKHDLQGSVRGGGSVKKHPEVTGEGTAMPPEAVRMTEGGPEGSGQTDTVGTTAGAGGPTPRASEER